MKVKVMIKVKTKSSKEAKELVTQLLNQAQRFDDGVGRRSLRNDQSQNA